MVFFFRSLPDPALLHVHTHPAGIGMYQMYTGRHTNTHAHGGGTPPGVHTYAHTHAHTHACTHAHIHIHTYACAYMCTYLRVHTKTDAVFCRGGGLLCKGGRFVSPMYFAVFCKSGGLVCYGCTLRCFAEVEGSCVMDVLCGVLQRWRACVSWMYFAVFYRDGELVCHGCTLQCFAEVEGVCVMCVLCGVLQKWRACVSANVSVSMYFAVFYGGGELVCHGFTLWCFAEVEGLCVMDVLCGVLQRLRVCRQTAAARREGWCWRWLVSTLMTPTVAHVFSSTEKSAVCKTPSRIPPSCVKHQPLLLPPLLYIQVGNLVFYAQSTIAVISGWNTVGSSCYFNLCRWGITAYTASHQLPSIPLLR